MMITLIYLRRIKEPPAWAGIWLVVGVAAIYAIVGDAATDGRLRDMYEVPLATVLAIYAAPLALSYYGLTRTPVHRLGGG